MTKGFLLDALDFSAADERSFNRAYDAERLPALRRLAPSASIERWIANDNPRKSILTCDLDISELPVVAAAAANETAGTTQILRFEGKQVWPSAITLPKDSPGLSIAAMDVEPAAEAEFLEWYDSEHLPQLAAVPGVLSARRFQNAGNSGRKYIAVYHITGPEVTKSDAWQACNRTKWTQKMLPHFRNTLVVRCSRYVPSP